MNPEFIKKIVHSPLSNWLLFVVISIVLVSAIGLKNMTLASSYKIFFDESSTDLQMLEQMEQTYSTTDNVFIMIEPPTQDIYTPQTMSLLYTLTQRLWEIDYVKRVDSVANYPFSQADGDDILIEEFIYEQQQITPEYVAFIKEHAQQERDLVGTLVTENGHYTAVNVTAFLPGNDHKKETLLITSGIENLLKELQQKYPQHTFSVTGIVTMNGAFFKAAKHDFSVLIPIMILVVLVISGLILGSVQASFCILFVLLCSLLGSLGVAGWLNIHLSAPSISAPIIMFTVIVASTIHIISFVKKQLISGAEQQNAVVLSYIHNANPIIISHVTTIIGFLAMNSSDSPPFRDLGNIVALGVFFSLLLSFTLLPYLLLRISISTKKSSALVIFTKVNFLSRFVINNSKVIFYLIMPACLVFSFVGLLNKGNDDLVKYFDESVEFRIESEHVDKHFSGLYNIGYSFDSGQSNGIYNIDFLTFIDEFESWLMSQNEVVITSSPIHKMKQLNQLMNADNVAFYRLADNATMAAQHFLLYEMSLPFGKDVTDMVNFDKSSLKVTARLNNSSAVEMMAFEQKVKGWLDINKPASISYSYSSPSLIFSHIGQTNIYSLFEGAFFAFCIISIALTFIFRSFLIGVLTLIPNLLPLGLAFAVWYVLSGEISMGLASVAAIAIGIIVDDTVHFLYQYIHGVKRGLTPQESVIDTFDKTMGAIVISSILLVMGFMLLASSSFEKNAHMGLLTSITIVFALIFDLVVLPVLAMKFIRIKAISHTVENKTQEKSYEIY